MFGREKGHFDLVPGEAEVWLRTEEGNAVVCFPSTFLDNFELQFPDEHHKNARGWGGVKIF